MRVFIAVLGGLAVAGWGCDDGGSVACTPSGCVAWCSASGLPGGVCLDGATCSCTEGADADADADAPAETAGDADATTETPADADVPAETPADADAPVDTGDPLESYRQRCDDEINRYRATEGKAPYGRWRGAETCTDGEARSDSETGTAHGAFGSCGEWAQNECPGWGSLEDTVTGCLAMMWAEGPGEPFSEHGHYINMSSTSYSQVSCGFYVTPSGSVWAIQNFQ